jgi:hypothetical protein
MVIWRLLKRSASQPPGMLKIRKGTENRKVTTETNVSRSVAPFMPTIIESSRLRRMLSLKAPWKLGGDQRPEASTASTQSDTTPISLPLRDGNSGASH